MARIILGVYLKDLKDFSNHSAFFILLIDSYRVDGPGIRCFAQATSTAMTLSGLSVEWKPTILMKIRVPSTCNLVKFALHCHSTDIRLNVLFVLHCTLQDSYIEMLHLTVRGCLFLHSSYQLSENTETFESSLQWQNIAPQISINNRNTLMHPLQKTKCMTVCLQVQQVTTGARDHSCVVKTKFFNPPHPCEIVKNYETCFQPTTWWK